MTEPLPQIKEGRRRKSEWSPVGPPSGGRARFRRNPKVLIVKLLLPLIAVGLVGLVLTWPQLQRDDDEFRLDATTFAGDEQQARPQVVNPRLSGVDADGQPFEITADIGTATVGENGTEVYFLTRPRADMVLSDESWLALSAAEGVYDTMGEVLTLRDGVRLFHDSGVEFQTESARIMMADHAAEGDEPVFGFGDFGEIRATGFRIVERGRRIIFTGRTRLVIVDDGASPFSPRSSTEVDEIASEPTR